MGIQPIDLQNMYSQLSNVSKIVGGQQQAAQMSDTVQNQRQVQKNLENSIKIQKANENSQSQTVNADGRNGSGYSGSNKKKDNSQEEEIHNIQTKNTTQSNYIGTIIDITR